MSRLKLLLIITHLGGGGAERVTALLAIHLNSSIFDIHLALITTDNSDVDLIPTSTTIHRLNADRVRNSTLKLFRLIRKINPDIILSNMAHLNFLVLLLGMFVNRKSIILVRQNTTASLDNTWLTRKLYRWLYPMADRVICQSQAMADDLAIHFAISSRKLAILANPVPVGKIRAQITFSQTPEASPEFTNKLIAVGRLSREKGFDLLLHAVAILRSRDLPVTLTIIGKGPARESLERLAHELSLSTHIVFPGHQTHLIPYYQAATLFVLPSRYEGMPNALLEAAAAGLPLVATRCCQGVVDLLNNAPGTWLTPSIDEQSLAQTIFLAITCGPPNGRFHHRFLAPFETETATAAYECLLVERAGRAR